MNVETAVKSFLKAALADGLRAATIKWYSSILTAFAAHFRSRESTTITADDIRDYIIHLRMKDERYTDAPQKPAQTGGLSESTVAGHITALHSFWSWSAKEYDIKNPMKNIKRPKRREPMPKAVEQHDIVKLFDACGEGAAGVRDRAMLALLTDTGCRLGGLLSLKLDNLNCVKRRAVVIEKGGRSRTIHFTFYTAQLLQKWLAARDSLSAHVFVNLSSGAPLTQSGVNQALKRLKTRAGVKGRVNPHSFRHAFARSYIQNGGDISTLAKLLGHSDINTTMMYYAIFTEDEQAEMHDQFTPMNGLRP